MPIMAGYQTIDVEGIEEALDLSRFTPVRVGVAVGVLIVGWLVGVLVKRIIRRLLRPIENLPDYLPALIGRLAQYSVFFIAVVIALETVGISLGPLVLSLGVFLIVIGLALRPLLENLAAGIILQARGPFRPGDQIITHGHEGTVEDINLRTVVIKTTDGVRVHIPNVRILDEPIVNLSGYAERRTRLEVGLEYGTDLALARRVALQAVATVEGVMDDPAPDALIFEFDESTINMAIRFWHESPLLAGRRVTSKVAIAVKQAFDDSGVTIAFPQRVLWHGEDE